MFTLVLLLLSIALLIDARDVNVRVTDVTSVNGDDENEGEWSVEAEYLTVADDDDPHQVVVAWGDSTTSTFDVSAFSDLSDGDSFESTSDDATLVVDTADTAVFSIESCDEKVRDVSMPTFTSAQDFESGTNDIEFPLGFTFTVDGTPYTNAVVSQHGYVTLGGTEGAEDPNDDDDDVGDRAATGDVFFAPLWFDFKAPDFTVPPPSGTPFESIYVETVFNADGNRTFVAQFHRVQERDWQRRQRANFWNSIVRILE